MSKQIDNLPGNHLSIKLWNYNPISIEESLREKKKLCEKDKCKSDGKCNHFYLIYMAKWDRVYKEYGLWNPGRTV